MTTRIACTGISGRILQGRVTADGKSFSGQTKDVTSDVLAAVIDKLKHHGGSFTINCNGEPVATLALSDPASQDQGEVQRLREALEEIADPIKFMRARLEDGEQLNGVYAIQMAESGSYLREIAKRAIAASTGQEVKP